MDISDLSNLCIWISLV